jgi:hypothetical protein
MQSFESFAIGDKIFVPSVRQKEVLVTCPDCLDEKAWTVSTPSGITKTIECPRCNGGKDNWLIPKRYEQTLEIKETTIAKVSIRSAKKYKSEEIAVSISYDTEAPYCGSVDHEKVYLTHEAAAEAGAIMMAEYTATEDKRWRENRERDEKRAGQDIITAIQSVANKDYKDLEYKVDQLREKMLDAIRYPNSNGPTLEKRLYGAPELTSQGLADWFSQMLRDCELEDWTENELHEALCHC